MEIRTDYHLHTFPNGIRWVHKQVKHTKIAHCGIMLDIGSRDEGVDQLGIAHFWEHMAFKGTKTKNSSYILHRIDRLGGELNAYTTKEKICFHASLLARHFDKAIELLVDITFNSTFPQKEIEKERQVILEEMTMYEDSPEDDIQDRFDDQIFVGNPLANNILGTKESVNKFNQADFHHFIGSHINTSRLVISTVSNLPVKRGLKILEKYVAQIPAYKNEFQRIAPTLPSKKHEVIRKPINQTHCMMGRTAYAQGHENRLAFFILTNLLGGPAMNTRLNIAIRERYGLVYSIDAQYSPYVDTGLFSIYFGAEKKNLKKAISLVLVELKKLREIKLTDSQLKAAKNQLKGQLAISEENNNGMMMLLARSILDLGHVESLDSIFSRIDAISADKLQLVANEMLKEEDICYLIFEPEK
jgi:predicted Zn-dependent peptidase